MKTTHYTLRFDTPAFLGNASQEAQWRTPPLKALMRQWWRVAYAANQHHRFDIRTMRHDEGLLFGHAWLDDDQAPRDGRLVKVAGRRSAVRLRLDRWTMGSLKAAEWPRSGAVTHPEVSAQVSSDLYLGYGPLKNENKQARPKAGTVVQVGESAQFSLAVPDVEWPLIQQTLELMNQFGTVGGRSRNGWGSLSLTPSMDSETTKPSAPPLRNWQEALTLDWPHVIGQDSEGPLIWQTRPHRNWREVMQTLARIKIDLRTQFKFPVESPKGAVHDRHWLSYPVTNHPVAGWEKARLPNSLRFKVRPVSGTPAGPEAQWEGLVFHMPCLPPPSFRPSATQIQQVWLRVHKHLDAQATLKRTSS